MTNGCIVVDKVAWERMTPSEQSYLIYDTLQSQDRRIKKLEQWLWLRITSQFFGAMIGGALVVLFAMKYGVKL